MWRTKKLWEGLRGTEKILWGLKSLLRVLDTELLLLLLCNNLLLCLDIK